ncbi:neuronal pentraxin-1-like [Glandiceps talaboti]
MWSKALSAAEIFDVYTDCSIGGDVFRWRPASLDISGDATLTCTDVCECTNAVILPTTNTEVVVQTSVPQLSALTACIWMKAIGNQIGTLVSYAVPGTDNEFIMYDTSGLYIFIKAANKKTNLNLNDGTWHHVCATWSSTDGSWSLYNDGGRYDGGTGFKQGSTITGGGTLVLGQEQDVVGGGYDQSQAFTGVLAFFNLWSNALSSSEIAKVHDGFPLDGNVFSWSVEGLAMRGDASTTCVVKE